MQCPFVVCVSRPIHSSSARRQTTVTSSSMTCTYTLTVYLYVYRFHTKSVGFDKRCFFFLEKSAIIVMHCRRTVRESRSRNCRVLCSPCYNWFINCTRWQEARKPGGDAVGTRLVGTQCSVLARQHAFRILVSACVLTCCLLGFCKRMYWVT